MHVWPCWETWTFSCEVVRCNVWLFPLVCFLFDYALLTATVDLPVMVAHQLRNHDPTAALYAVEVTLLGEEVKIHSHATSYAGGYARGEISEALAQGSQESMLIHG